MNICARAHTHTHAHTRTQSAQCVGKHTGLKTPQTSVGYQFRQPSDIEQDIQPPRAPFPGDDQNNTGCPADLEWWESMSQTAEGTHENTNYSMNPSGERRVGQPQPGLRGVPCTPPRTLCKVETQYLDLCSEAAALSSPWQC